MAAGNWSPLQSHTVSYTDILHGDTSDNQSFVWVLKGRTWTTARPEALFAVMAFGHQYLNLTSLLWLECCLSLVVVGVFSPPSLLKQKGGGEKEKKKKKLKSMIFESKLDSWAVCHSQQQDKINSLWPKRWSCHDDQGVHFLYWYFADVTTNGTRSCSW